MPPPPPVSEMSQPGPTGTLAPLNGSVGAENAPGQGVLFLKKRTSANGKASDEAASTKAGKSTTRRLHHVACYLKPDEYSQLKEQAAKRRLSVSTYVKGCLLGHHKAAALQKGPGQRRPVRRCAPVPGERETDRRTRRREGR